jgi:hypothetical protein
VGSSGKHHERKWLSLCRVDVPRPTSSAPCLSNRHADTHTHTHTRLMFHVCCWLGGWSLPSVCSRTNYLVFKFLTPH